MREEKLEYIAKYYGFEHQCNKCIEEMAELAIEISKYNNARNPVEKEDILYKLETELADVEILIKQLKILTHGKLIDQVADAKIERQLKRIEKEISKHTKHLLA